MSDKFKIDLTGYSGLFQSQRPDTLQRPELFEGVGLYNRRFGVDYPEDALPVELTGFDYKLFTVELSTGERINVAAKTPAIAQAAAKDALCRIHVNRSNVNAAKATENAECVSTVRLFEGIPFCFAYTKNKHIPFWLYSVEFNKGDKLIIAAQNMTHVAQEALAAFTAHRNLITPDKGAYEAIFARATVITDISRELFLPITLATLTQLWPNTIATSKNHGRKQK